ncbi:hypothetical protein L9F63_010868 [Diploptera punctata]|uniref:Tetratricopeptide repeat protein 12 n=1 Tax=Diploptera punctata TaxID=6984 RepID=A0AAD8AHV6_DIPPU|nr:hypothetical protein L9F63_010868 [Diploptera punctata]
MLTDLKTSGPDISSRALQKNDVKLDNEEKIIKEDGLKIKTNKTIINKQTSEYDPRYSKTTSAEAFMAYMEKDAQKRAADKQERKAIADDFKKKGNYAFGVEDYENAYNYYSKAIEKIKDSCLLYTNRALTCLRLGLYSRAISDCEWAHKLNEKNLKAWLYKAKAYHKLGESDKAEECIMAAKTHHPNHKLHIQGKRLRYWTENNVEGFVLK